MMMMVMWYVNLHFRFFIRFSFYKYYIVFCFESFIKLCEYRDKYKRNTINIIEIYICLFYLLV